MKLRYLPAIVELLVTLILASQLPVHAGEICKPNRIDTFALQYTGPNLEITTTGNINSQPARFLVDTAGGLTALTKNGVATSKLKVSSTRQVVRGIGGMSPVGEATIDRLSIGITDIGTGKIPVLTNLGFVPNYDAIVAAPFFSQFDFELFLKNKTLVIFNSTGCLVSPAELWGVETGVVPIDSYSAGVPYFTVEVNGIRMNAVIDSGSASTVITARAAKLSGVVRKDQPHERLADAVGVGNQRMSRWLANVQSLKIANKLYKDISIAVIDYEGKMDLLLGADFLRSHRIFVSRSQNKIFISYVDGPPFLPRGSLDSWIITEAQSDNAEAQLVLAQAYASKQRPEGIDSTAEYWLERASNNGHPNAKIISGRRLMLKGAWEEASRRLRAGLAQLPLEKRAPLWLYISEVQAKRPAAAYEELSMSLNRYTDGEWAKFIAQYYLGQISLTGLVNNTTKTESNVCLTFAAVNEWNRAHQVEAGTMIEEFPVFRKCKK